MPRNARHPQHERNVIHRNAHRPAVQDHPVDPLRSGGRGTEGEESAERSAQHVRLGQFEGIEQIGNQEVACPLHRIDVGLTRDAG